MRLYSQRGFFTKESTASLLVVNESLQCFLLEDQIRNGVKVPGETAIPFGEYEIDLTMSQRFGMILPILLNVLDFEGIRIHPGNTDKDTSGCLLPGEELSIANNDLKLIGSKIAFDKLMVIFRAAKDRGEKITILVTKEY